MYAQFINKYNRHITLFILLAIILKSIQLPLFKAIAAKTVRKVIFRHKVNSLISDNIVAMNDLNIKTISANNIQLTEEEIKIFQIVLDSLKYHKKNTIARVAGGWVRDKLLSRDSDDIDIAVDDQSGVEFANGINEYLTYSGESTKTVAVIQANPEQSKHLETANIRILDRFIDCVNLRTETYADNSRIPDIKYGTALEDALRRDFTINSLFYNINTNEIEDWTGQGFHDLQNGIIRTPLDPLTTFTDDPLRVLRAIRFASRLRFTLTDELVKTASLESIHSALISKISRERVYKELLGMYNQVGHPVLADIIIYRLKLLDAVLIFDYPIEKIIYHNLIENQLIFGIINNNSNPNNLVQYWKDISLESSCWLTLILCLIKNNNWNIQNNVTVITKQELLSISGGEINCKLYITALCSGFTQISVKDPKGKILPVASVVLKDSLKADIDTIKFVQLILDCIPTIFSYSRKHFVSINDTMIIREQAGILIRQLKDTWHNAIYLACAYELALTAIHLKINNYNPNELYTFIPHNNDIDMTIVNQYINIPDIEIKFWIRDIINRYISLESLWTSLDLEHIYDMKPILDGSQLMLTFPNIKKGPMVGKVMDEQIRWQLRRPNGNKDELVAYLTDYLNNNP